MTKQASDAPRRLLDAGRAVARERGCGAIKVREVARAAGVNLGLFHYHFKTRDAFVRRVLDETYADFFARLNLSVDRKGSPRERLRAALTAIAQFSREHRRMVVGMLRDAMTGDRLVIEFAGRSFPNHLPIVLGLIKEGVRAKELRDLPEPLVLALLMGVISTPNIMATLVECSGAKRPLGRSVAQFQDELLSDAAIAERVDIVLAGLSRKGGKR
ncbi:MAG: TetR family transcriptional regulator [Elusimicrobia bacterium]|nr:MAG: TetR family transcriptional regulator [Elusimicrobiota bacterium]